MFKRHHHQRIAQILASLNQSLLCTTDCFFAGGTAITLLLNEYRESIDIDFLCSSSDGYRTLRNTITQSSLGALLPNAKYLRDVRADRYGIRTIIVIDDTPIKFEIVREDRISLSGAPLELFSGVPTLHREDLFAEKLLANTDLGLDKMSLNRDMIDLALMCHYWEEIPLPAWKKAETTYGKAMIKCFNEVRTALLDDEAYLVSCLNKMSMDSMWLNVIQAVLSRINVPE